MALAITIFCYYFYRNSSDDLYNNLDMSIEQVANSFYDILVTQLKLDNVYKNIEYTVDKVKESKHIRIYADSSRLLNTKLSNLNSNKNYDLINKNGLIDILDSLKLSVDTLINQSNKTALLREKSQADAQDFYIVIVDKEHGFSWCSDNLDDSMKLTLFLNNLKIEHTDRFEAAFKSPVSGGGRYNVYYYNASLQKQRIRLCELHFKDADIIVAYSLKNVDATLNRLLVLILLFIPAIIIITIFVGLMFLNYPFKRIEAISNTAKDFSSANIKDRFKIGKNNEISMLESNLNSLFDRFEKTIQHLKKFNSDTAHELKTPLTILRGELSIALQNTKKPEEFTHIISSTLDEVIRLSNIVETLLELSRAETGNLQMNFSEVDLSVVLKDILDDTEILAEEKNLYVHSDIERNIKCYADADRIHQAILNIIENSVKYTPAGGYIDLILKKSENFAVIEIKDTGIGIPESQKELVFDRFFRSDNARINNIPGMGLGLPLVKLIVDAHKGEVILNSEMGKGSSFILKIPLFAK